MDTLIYSPGAKKDLTGLSRDVAVRIHTSLKSIKIDSYSRAKKLEGSPAVPLYSYRIGQYRCILTIEDSKLVIFVIEIGHRRNIYREDDPLAQSPSDQQPGDGSPLAPHFALSDTVRMWRI